MGSKSPVLSLENFGLGVGNYSKSRQPPAWKLVSKELVGIQLLTKIPPQFQSDYILTKIKLNEIVK